MSMLPPGIPHAPVGDLAGSYTEYEAAQQAVTKLIEADVAARDIAIVGIGLRSVERVTSKLGYGTAARSGAMNGLLLGLVFVVLFTIGQEVPIPFVIGLLICGIALGMLLSLITYLVVRRRRSYASVMQVVADHYEVRVMNTSIHRAREVLGTVPAPRTAPAAPPSNEPPRYGERLPAGQTPVAPNPAQEPTQAPPANNEPPRYGERLPEGQTAVPTPAQEPTPVAPVVDEPPRFGERITPQQPPKSEE